MSERVTMPALGESVTEGTVTRWLKQQGEHVERDEPLLEVSTDKVDTEIPAPAAGYLARILAGEDETIAVGAQLAVLEDSPEPDAGPGGATTYQSDATPDAPQAPKTADELEPAMGSDHAAPPPSGLPGTETATDQPTQHESAPDTSTPDGVASPGTTATMSRLRQIIARRMTESLHVSAQLTTVQQVDLSRISRLREAAKAAFEAREGVKLTYLPFIAKATVEALEAFPAFNASLNDSATEITYHDRVHLAIAVDTPRGLLAPVIKDAHTLSLSGLARHIADVAARTRNNMISPDELTGGTFTITNIGTVGALVDTPIINQPQVAILATGAVSKQPIVVTTATGDECIAIRPVCYLPLTYDHRLIDGADAGRFVAAVKSRLEQANFGTDLGL